MRKQLLIIFFCLSQYIANSQDIAKQNYEHLSLEDGLSQGFITATIQDKTGFIWFGTNDGLNRYDGYEFKKYYNNIYDTTSISSNQITALANDISGKLWVGTNNGLNCYDPSGEKFYRYNLFSKANKSSFINCLNADETGLIWLTYLDDPYLYCFNSKTNHLESYKLPQNSTDYFENTSAYHARKYGVTPFSLVKVSKESFLIGSNSGELLSFNTTTKKFQHLYSFENKVFITSIVEIEKGNFLICFSDGSFYFFNLITKEVSSNYHLNPYQKKSAYSGIFMAVKDANNNIYFGTQGEGVFFFDVKKKIIEQILFVEPNDKFIISKGVRSLFIDKSGILWCGTNGYGVYNLSPKSNAFKTINQGLRYLKEKFTSYDIEIYATYKSDEIYRSLSFQSVRGIYASDDYIFVGGYAGFDKIDRKKGNVTSISKNIIPYVICPDKTNPEKYLWIGNESTSLPLYRFDIQTGKLISQPIDCQFIFAIFPDENNILWIGTTTRLVRYNTIDKTSSYYSNIPGDPNSLQPGPVRAIKKDLDGILWIGTETGGLSMLDENSGRFTRYQNKVGNSKSLSNNTILYITVDKFNNLLIGTAGGGISILDHERKSFLNITTLNGLPNNVVYAIIEDNHETFWISTNNGICAMNPNNRNIKYFNSADGLQGNEYNTGSYFKDKNGVLFFGGVNGLTYFDPDKIVINEYKPDIVLTYIRKNNIDQKFDKPLSEINEITFEHNDNSLTIGVSALSFYQSNKNEYAYKLSGSEDMVMLGTNHEISFNSLEEGTYTLEVFATNNDGVWNNKPLVLSIIINPPFWRTWWFIFLCFIVVSSLVLLYIYYRVSSAKKINMLLSKQVEERTKEISQQKFEIENQKIILEDINSELSKVNTAKDKFFSIIAHDLKSPFNAILGFSRLLNEEYSILSDENRRAFAGNIKDASEATYRLLENLLEWSRMQANKIEFKPEIIDLGNIVIETFSLLHSSAEAKNIRLSSSVMFNTTAFADENMIKTVVRNLVSNAIKFTQKDGEVKISASEINDYLEVSVSDNGVGISEDDFRVLFQVDVSLKSRGTANESGTGLGLIICKEFIERNGGKITVKSTIDIGSTFLFTLPKSDKV